MVPGGPKDEVERKVHRKVEIALSEKGAGGDCNGHKGRGKERKGKGKEGAYPTSGFSTREAPSEEKHNQPWEPR